MLGDAELDGTLSITLQTIPSLGDSFKIISANNITGQFSNVVGTDIGNDLILKVVYQTDAVLVEAINAAIPGDLDGDGFVGINDLNLILTNWNQTVPPGDAIADANGDNFIGIADLNAVLGNWNAGTPPTDQANIPEPTTLILFFILSPTLTRRR
jgi:hypothetical protein